MHKSATKYNETIGKWCKNKHGASKIIDTLETYHLTKLTKDHAVAELAVGYFDSVHPLPEVYVCLLLYTCCRIH
jgi:hypothetical protein